MRSARRSKRTNDPQGVRSRLLDAAAALFQSRGYGGTSIADIASEAGVTSGALHHHYPTKKDLTLGVIRDRVAQTVDSTWIQPVADAPSTYAGVKRVMDTIYSDLAERDGVRGCQLNNLTLELSLVDDDFRNELAGIFDAWKSALARKLYEDRAVGEAPKTIKPDITAGFIVASFSGAMTLAKAQQSAAPLRGCRDEILRALK